MADPNAPKKIKTVLNTPKLRLSAPCPTAKGKYSTLSYDLYLNNPRIVIATNDPALMSPDKGYGRITAALDMPMFYVYLELIKRAIASPGEWKHKVENYGNTKGGDPKNPSHLTDLWVGKDSAGAVFVSVVSKQDGMPVIKFTFGPSDERFHIVKESTGAALSKSDVSNLFAQAHVNMLTQIMGNLAVTTFVEPPPYIPPNKGGYNRQGGGGGYSKPNYTETSNDSVNDDDIPF